MPVSSGVGPKSEMAPSPSSKNAHAHSDLLHRGLPVFCMSWHSNRLIQRARGEFNQGAPRTYCPNSLAHKQRGTRSAENRNHAKFAQNRHEVLGEIVAAVADLDAETIGHDKLAMARIQHHR